MSRLNLIAAGICGSALTLAVSTLAQAPKRAPTIECHDNTDLLIDMSRDVYKIPAMKEQLDAIVADQKSTMHWAQYASSDLDMVKREVTSMSITLDQRR